MKSLKNTKLWKRLSKSKKEIKEFSICLGIVFLFWIFITSSQEYEYTLSYPLHIELKDSDNHIVHQSVSSISIQFQSNGIEALYRKRSNKRKELFLNISDIDPVTEANVYLLNLQSHQESILSQFQISNQQKTNIITQTLRIPLIGIEKKKVKVNADNIRYNFAPQHSAYGIPILFPDSVYIEGNATIVEKINVVETKPYEFDNISSSNIYYLNLKEIPSIHLNPGFVALYIPADEYTEYTISVPVKVLFPADEYEVKAYPENVEITTLVALKDYSKVSPELFFATTRLADTLNGKMPVRLSQFPDFVHIQKISPQEVQYVIIK